MRHRLKRSKPYCQCRLTTSMSRRYHDANSRQGKAAVYATDTLYHYLGITCPSSSIGIDRSANRDRKTDAGRDRREKSTRGIVRVLNVVTGPHVRSSSTGGVADGDGGYLSNAVINDHRSEEIAVGKRVRIDIGYDISTSGFPKQLTCQYWRPDFEGNFNNLW